MATAMPERCRCLVPGCRRTTAVAYSEHLCARHWSLVPKATRRAYNIAKRRQKASAALDRLWARCRRLALEAVADDLFGPGPGGSDG